MTHSATEEGINTVWGSQSFHFILMATPNQVPLSTHGKPRQDEFFSAMFTCSGGCNQEIPCRCFIGFFENVDKVFCPSCTVRPDLPIEQGAYIQKGEAKAARAVQPKPSMTLTCTKCRALVLIKAEFPLKEHPANNIYRFTLKDDLVCHKHHCEKIQVHKTPAPELQEAHSQPIQNHHLLDDWFAGPPIHVVSIYRSRPFTVRYLVVDESK